MTKFSLTYSRPMFPFYAPYSVWIRENTDQKKLRIWTLSRSDWWIEEKMKGLKISKVI